MTDTPKMEMPEGAWTFDFEKMSAPAAIALGRAMAYADLVQRLAPHALKAIDLRERATLDKIIRTSEAERVAAMEAAIELAKKTGAVTRQKFAPSTETAQ